MSSRRRVHRHRRHRRECRRKAWRNWADLPTDALLEILRRLDHIDALMAADRVCRAWRRAARDESSLWRRITMRGDFELEARLNRFGMAAAAVRRSAGQCEAFCGEYAGDDRFLVFLGTQVPCLKSLRLISCSGVTTQGLKKAVKDFPLLEELELSLCYNVCGGHVYKIVASACPQLKRFRPSKNLFDYRDRIMDKEARGIANMHGLRSLQLFNIALTNEGLAIILDNCSKMEPLDIRHCFHIKIDENMLTKCSRIKKLRLPGDPTDDYDLQVYKPIRGRANFSSGWSRFWYLVSDSDRDSESDDSDDSDL